MNQHDQLDSKTAIAYFIMLSSKLGTDVKWRNNLLKNVSGCFNDKFLKDSNFLEICTTVENEDAYSAFGSVRGYFIGVEPYKEMAPGCIFVVIESIFNIQDPICASRLLATLKTLCGAYKKTYESDLLLDMVQDACDLYCEIKNKSRISFREDHSYYGSLIEIDDLNPPEVDDHFNSDILPNLPVNSEEEELEKEDVEETSVNDVEVPDFFSYRGLKGYGQQKKFLEYIYKKLKNAEGLKDDQRYGHYAGIHNCSDWGVFNFKPVTDRKLPLAHCCTFELFCANFGLQGTPRRVLIPEGKGLYLGVFIKALVTGDDGHRQVPMNDVKEKWAMKLFYKSETEQFSNNMFDGNMYKLKNTGEECILKVYQQIVSEAVAYAKQ